MSRRPGACAEAGFADVRVAPRVIPLELLVAVKVDAHLEPPVLALGAWAARVCDLDALMPACTTGPARKPPVSTSANWAKRKHSRSITSYANSEITTDALLWVSLSSTRYFGFCGGLTVAVAWAGTPGLTRHWGAGRRAHVAPRRDAASALPLAPSSPVAASPVRGFLAPSLPTAAQPPPAPARHSPTRRAPARLVPARLAPAHSVPARNTHDSGVQSRAQRRRTSPW